MSEEMHQSVEEPEEAQPAVPQVSEFDIQAAMQQLKSEQNLGMGVVGGLMGMVIGAVLWAVITVVTDYQIGWMAIGVGFLVGLGVQLLGKGLSSSFGVAAAVLAGVGCLLGNFLVIIGFVSQEFGLTYGEIFAELDGATMVELMTATFQPMDLLFYGLAIYTGYRGGFRKMTQEQIMQLAQQKSGTY
jgi:hypothetical protein